MERPAPRTPIRTILRNVLCTVRDGTRLAADVYLPGPIDTPQPTILIRTPYGKEDPTEQGAPLAKFLASQGFCVVVQDLRGTGASDGEFRPYGGIEGPDGWDTLDWLIAQSWCDGQVGTVGCSYHGEVQDMLAALRHPAHRAAFIEGAYTYDCGGRMRAFSFVRQGVRELAYAVGGDEALLERLPLASIRAGLPSPKASYYANRWPDAVDRWLTACDDDPYWDEDGGLGDDAGFDVPAIHMNEWYSLPFSSLRFFDQYSRTATTAAARDNQFLVISPMTHCKTSSAAAETVVGERDLGDARFDYFGLMTRWFDHWLRGADNGVTEEPRVRTYLMGANQWRAGDCWPPAGTRFTDVFLGPEGALRDAPEGEGADAFVYDPADPVPSLGGPVAAGDLLKPGGFDQRPIEARPDVLVYSTAPLDEGVEVSGPIEVVLHVSSDAPDTDFTAKLVDVYPDGRAFNLVEGIVRMRFRDGAHRAALMSSHEVYEARIDLDSTSNWFGPGHRIRLEVSSSNFPRFDRNLNTGRDGAHDAAFGIAANTVHHGAARPSRIILPIVRAG